MRKLVTNDQSGHCRFGGDDSRMHLACRVEWDTPSATVTCCCPCHARYETEKVTVVKKKVAKPTGVVVKKKSKTVLASTGTQA